MPSFESTIDPPEDNLPRPVCRVEPAKTLIRSSECVDPWFLGRYGMNLYRGCEHACVYCDGRAERYFVSGVFDRDILVKGNAVELFQREIARRKEPGFVFLGGGVCDAYQPVEGRFRLARGVLEVVASSGLPVHVLTKSSLVERDFDLLARIHASAHVILSMSLQSVDEAVRRTFEPRASPVARRLETLRRAKSRGFTVGVMALPVLPGISDRAEDIEALVGAASEVGADFLCGGSLTLRAGTQKDAYLAVIRREYPALLPGYGAAYRDEKASGVAAARYVERVDARFAAASVLHGMAGRVPYSAFAGRIPLYAEVGVLIEHRAFERASVARSDDDVGTSDISARALAAAGWAVQRWARARLVRVTRQRGSTYRQVEGEFRTLCRSGDLARVIPMPERAVQEVLAVLARVDEHRNG